jgi:hypothetical protein
VCPKTLVASLKKGTLASSNVDPPAGSELDLVAKSGDYPSQRMRGARAFPIGTERHRVSCKTKGMVLIKVSNHGKQRQRWRPKQHVIWERANGQKVPPGFRVVFKDGNKENFDPANLELNTRGEIFARAMARFLANPPSLRKVIRLNRQLERELWRQMNNHAAPPGAETAIRSVKRWSRTPRRQLRRLPGR